MYLGSWAKMRHVYHQSHMQNKNKHINVHLYSSETRDQPVSYFFQGLFSAVCSLRCKELVKLIWAVWLQLFSHNRQEPLVHEWSASLNEQELTPVLPSNRETGCLSDTWIKMDAFYFLPCSVWEQVETEEGVKVEEKTEELTHMWGGGTG